MESAWPAEQPVASNEGWRTALVVLSLLGAVGWLMIGVTFAMLSPMVPSDAGVAVDMARAAIGPMIFGAGLAGVAARVAAVSGRGVPGSTTRVVLTVVGLWGLSIVAVIAWYVVTAWFAP